MERERLTLIRGKREFVQYQLLSVSASLLAASLAGAQLPRGYHLGTAIAVPDTLVEVHAGGRFRATVSRSWRSSEERQRILTAEALYPSTDVLLRAAGNAEERNRLGLMDSGASRGGRRNPSPRAAGSPADRWWFDSFDYTWVPFAVTGAAVDYYLGRIRDLAAGRGQFTYARGQPADRGTLEYTAIVRRDSSAGRGYIVELRLSWSYWCGDMCAMTFTQTRTVSFDSAGAVVGISGDARPSVIVS